MSNDRRPSDAAGFEDMVRALRESRGADPVAFGVGLATYADADDAVLDTWFPVPNLQENEAMAAVLADAVGHAGGAGTVELTDAALDEVLARCRPLLDDGREHPNMHLLSLISEGRGGPASPLPVHRRVVATFLDDLAAPPRDAHDVYLRLHLLSSRRIRPHGASLEGAFGLLANVVWTDLGPCDVASFDGARARLRLAGTRVRVTSVDKFPRMLDYVVPGGVRIADGERVRLGAHLAEGTTVMHEGFVNFNAGTLGPAMVEGRISAGVVVGADSDLGGGASVMGTLSGGGKEVITVGEGCLVGANAGIGISLGDRCVVEAGLYVTAGTVVTTPGGETAKARELSGVSDLLFRRNSTTGAVEVLPRRDAGSVGLNEALHAN